MSISLNIFEDIRTLWNTQGFAVWT